MRRENDGRECLWWLSAFSSIGIVRRQTVVSIGSPVVGPIVCERFAGVHCMARLLVWCGRGSSNNMPFVFTVVPLTVTLKRLGV